MASSSDAAMENLKTHDRVLSGSVRIMAHYWNGGYTIGMVAILLKRWLTIGMVAILLEWWLYY